MTRVLAYLRHHALAALALVCSLLSLAGASYAAFSLPAGSVGTRELKNGAVTAAKLNPTSVAASIRAWANLTWAGGWHVQASSSDIHVATTGFGEVVSWRHTRFPSNCMASVTPQRNFAPGGPGGTGRLDGYVSTFFDPRGGQLQIDGIASDGTPQAQGRDHPHHLPLAGKSKSEPMKRLAVSLAVASASLLLWSPAALGASYNVYVCGPWSSNTGPFVPAAVPGTQAFVFGCGSTAATWRFRQSASPAVPNGQGASWTATAPAGLSITHIYTLGDSGGNRQPGAFVMQPSTASSSRARPTMRS